MLNFVKTEIFAICDAATDSAGKLNILGAFDTIYAPKTPVVHPACAVAIRVRFDKSEEGEHPFKLIMIDHDGGTVAGPVEGKMAVRAATGFDTITVNLILNFQGLELKRYGTNRVDLAIDNQLRAGIPLYVKAISPR